MTLDRATELRDGLTQQAEIYEVLATMTRQQHAVLEAGDVEEIVRLVQAKEHELARIESIDGAIGPLKESWKDWRSEVVDPTRSEVEAALGRVSQVLEELIALEREGQDRFEEGKRNRADALRKIEGGRRVNKAYGQPGGGAPRRILDTSQ